MPWSISRRPSRGTDRDRRSEGIPRLRPSGGPGPAGRWIDAWFRAWTEHDPSALDGTYAPGPVQRSAPFREPEVPQRYAEGAFADEDLVEVWFREAAVDTDGAAACEWWAISRDHAGEVVTLAGVSILLFDAGGRVVDQRDYWSQEPGSRHPPADWQPVARHGSSAT